MKRRQKLLTGATACRWLAVAVLALAPATALAARDEAEPEMVDARLEGYAQNVTLPAASSALTWIAFIVLSAVAAGGLFKDAKRSHLD